MLAFTTDVAVVGSGFGGSVAALRAAQAGRRVLVLEQGRRLAPQDLQAGADSARHLLWEPRARLFGYFRQTLLRDVIVLGGVGVGGGSLVYAAVLLEPDPSVLAGPGWVAGIDWAAELAGHFATAAQMLGRRENPDRGLQDRWLQAAALRLDAADTFAPTPQGIDFGACTRCGQCLSGCPYGAKRSTDLTYLAQAEAIGARIRPRSRAEILVPLGRRDGRDGWRIVMTDPLRRRAGASSITAREVVVASGVLGTNELLLASRDRWRTLPGLSSMAGRSVRTNSEAFSAIVHPAGTDISPGAAISSHFSLGVSTHVTNNRLPRSFNVMRLYLGGHVDATEPGARRAAALRGLLRHPLQASAPARTRDWHRRTTVLTVMQSEDNALELRYTRRGSGWALRSRRPAGTPPVPAYLPQAEAVGRAVAEVSGGTAYTTLLESLLGIGATAHILGGAIVADDATQGVVDSDHRVFGYEGLRVMDGSVVPSNLGVNPSLTITAMAERAMQRWLG
jgi:cholesterol oxidase